MIQLGGFLGRLLGPLLKTGLPLMKNVIKALAKSVLIPLVWNAAASARDAGIHKKVLWSGNHHSDSALHDNTILIISNDEIEDIIRIVKSLEDSCLLLKGVSEATQNEAKGEKGGFLSMLLGTLGPSLLGIILAGKGVIRAGDGAATKKQGKRAIAKRQSQRVEEFLMPPHPSTNFEIQKYYQDDSRLNGVYSRDNLPKIKDGAYVINLDEYSDIGTHWITSCMLNNDVTYFDSFGVEHIPEEIKTHIKNKSIKTNILRIQAYDLVMCGYFCIGFIDLMLAGKTLTHFINLFFSK